MAEQPTAPVAVADAPATPPVATPPEPTPAVASVTTQAWRYGGYEGRVVTTPRCRIYTTATNRRFLERLPTFYEAAIDVYTSAFGTLPQPEEPLIAYLFSERTQWQMKAAEVLGEEAGAFNALGRGGFTTNGVAVLYYLDWSRSRSSRDTFALAAHEGWHQYTQRTFRTPLPVWMEEGVATYMENFRFRDDGSLDMRPDRNGERWGTLRRAVWRDTLIPLDELLVRTPQEFLQDGKTDLLTYYAQVWALTRFLVEHDGGRYEPAFIQLLHDAADGTLGTRLRSARASTGFPGRAGPAVAVMYFDDDLDAFGREYLEFVHDITGLRRVGDRGRSGASSE